MLHCADMNVYVCMMEWHTDIRIQGWVQVSPSLDHRNTERGDIIALPNLRNSRCGCFSFQFLCQLKTKIISHVKLENFPCDLVNQLHVASFFLLLLFIKGYVTRCYFRVRNPFSFESRAPGKYTPKYQHFCSKHKYRLEILIPFEQ